MTSALPIPFSLRFAEVVPAVPVQLDYDDTLQVSRSVDPLRMITTHVETATGGHGDTDSESDTD